MVCNIIRDVIFLSQKAEPATEADRQIAVNMGIVNVAMFNPVIVKRSGPFETEEGCLSLTGVRRTGRYQEIEVEYQDMQFQRRRQKFSGWTAQIIQHECDHLEGILI